MAKDLEVKFKIPTFVIAKELRWLHRRTYLSMQL